MPSCYNGTELSAEEFRDNLRIRYGLVPLNLPAACDGCHRPFDVGHALSCKQGGLVTQRHNAIAGELHQLCTQAFTPSAVTDEPLIPHCQPRAPVNGRPAPLPPQERGDVACRGFWKRGTTAIFDVRITDTDAPSQRLKAPHRILLAHENEKKKKYLRPCLEARWQFTPLVFLVDGVMGDECKAATKRLASQLAAKWERPYSDMCSFVHSRFALALT
jgi:hypothetical protein